MLPTLKSFMNLPNVVDHFFGRDFFEDVWEKTGISVPSVNIIEGKEVFKIEVAAPGLKKDDFKIDIQNNVMTICSEKENKIEEESEKYLRREFGYSKFCRRFSLPLSVESDKISASHSEGILTIVLPKREEAKEKGPRSVEIL